ncbi:ABC transporter permease [Belnapia sp. T6]|uniref:ABC transporter permease n=1 Tax=Belnapia mucosa TaxID=2804532 RepID=A0ABS1UWL5_9PROT|nr:ABC transporter permease [Belnapia mucosa]MBL6453866.1 ABC transporter permease [Belnapia mucosa]
MSATTQRRAPPGGAFARQMRVIGALTLRELGTRFGRDNLGYLWLFVEPALLGGTIGAVHYFTGHGLPGGLNPFEFWVGGYVPFYLFRGVVNRAPSAVPANQSLLYHRHITLLDIMIARDVLEGAAVLGAMIAFLAIFGIVFGDWPDDPFKMLIGMMLMLLIAHGVAMLIATGAVYTEIFDRVTHLVTYLTLPITGAFWMVFWLPSEAQQAALWVPTVHLFEMIRDGHFGKVVPTTYDVNYAIYWAAGLNLLGMAGLRRARLDLVV